ncbi:ribosomal protein S12 methylthiotransferase accessory factor [Rhizobium paranaense]|uniref:Ribosomal protein S12 methylthiotransferase accessory factor n=1 Tax=Rhizobium paranaense TaxID=1650438 RepID=A0A7W8XRB0_9HYPH|nr:ribosomal protein S12 methylthiotransferase accessory factor [Rhizobium paranaense]
MTADIVTADLSLSLAEFLARNSSERDLVAASLYSDRVCTAEETFRRIEPCLTGHGITRLGRLTGLDRIGIPVWQAISPNAKSIVINNGKGITDLDAKVSAAMEALERTVAGAPAVKTISASQRELLAKGQHADPLSSLIASGQADIGDDEEIAWTEGRDLIADRNVWIPFGAITLDRTPLNARFWQSSDGLASGNVLTEAILHGLLERIERDAKELWDVSEPALRTKTCVDPASLADPVLNELLRKIEDAGLTLKLFDMTSDVKIPAYTVFLGPGEINRAKHVRYIDVTMGCGAHPSSVRAAIRAVTEAAQSRLTFISGARDDIHPKDFTRELPESIRRYFEAVPKAAARPDEALPDGAEALLHLTIDRLRHAGINSAIALSLGDASLPFAVAKLILPQLENPAGDRKRRFGYRAISKTLQLL